jgi:hypothetical protein
VSGPLSRMQNEQSLMDDVVRASSSARPLLCIVSAYRPDVLKQATNALAAIEHVEIIMDRRVGKRRRPECAKESRLRDRRRRSMKEQLRTHSFVTVHRDAAPAQCV